MSSIAITALKKHWGGDEVIRNISFEVPAGTLTVLLGPSGCGKSTILRMIAGLETASSGSIRIAGQEVLDLDASKRGVSMVFQSYALFPHMNVRENILFGLKVRKVPRSQQNSRMIDAAKVVGLDRFLDRKPAQLSGGQRQRVALARAIVSEQPVCLMDEPLSNLDAKLRAEMRSEIVSLQKNLGLTMVYVTHDQVEAMSMADQIVLLNEGIIEQQGPPEALYEKPESIFVSSFIGAPPMNIVEAASLESGSIASMLGWSVDKYKQIDSFGIRPESINISETGIPVKVQSVDYLGGESILKVKQGTCVLIVKVKGNYPLKTQQDLNIGWSVDDIIEFDRDGKSMKAVSKERRGE